MVRIVLNAVCLLLLMTGSVFAAEELAVIVNKENSNAVDRAMISKIYLGNISRWPSGGAVVALDQPEESPTTAAFAARIVGKPIRSIKDLWAQNVFTGKAIPPKVLANDEEVKKMVARSKNSIGYIKSSSADNSVKVVFTVR